MRKILGLMLLACLLLGCQSPNRAPSTETALPSVTTSVTEAVPETTLEPFIREEVTLDPVNQLAFCKTKESPSVAVLDNRTAAFLTREYQNMDFSVPYTRIRVLDLHMDVVRREVLLEGEYEVIPHCGANGYLALTVKEEDRVLVLDMDLREVLTFRTKAPDGVLSPDLSRYYYVWGSRLYCMDTQSGNSQLYQASHDLLLDEIWGYEPVDNILLVSVFEDTYTANLCMGAIDLDNGEFMLLYRGITAGKIAGNGVILENKHEDLLSSDLYYGDWSDDKLKILWDFLPNNMDFASWHVAGSDYLCKFTYDNTQVNIVDFQLYRLGQSTEVCSLQSFFKGAKINGTYALVDGNLLAVAVSSRGYQTYLICPDQLTFDPVEPETEPGNDLVDGSILENYHREPDVELPEKMAEVRARADELEETYGITILLSNQCKLAASYCEYPIVTTDGAGLKDEVGAIREALKWLEEVLKRYPENFFRQFRNEAGERGLLVLLVEDIKPGSNVIGVSYGMGQWYPIAVDITSGQVRSTYYHEIWHATENRIGDVAESALDLAAWEDLNPAGFRYSGYTDDYMGDTQYTFFYGNPGEEVYFVDPYGKTKGQEDRARLMEYVMATEWDAKMMLEHPVLKAKLQLLCDAIRQSFDTEDWEKLYWERFF